MRKNLTLSLAVSALVVAACGKSKSPASTAMNADLKRDIQLASVTQNLAINPDEVSPGAKPEVAVKMKKAPHAPKVVRDQHPTEMASAAPVQAAEVQQNVPQPQVIAAAPAPAPAPVSTEAPALPPLARPTSAPASAPGNGDGHGAGGNAGNGGAAGGVLGGIIGAVIRGGMIGDDDHCDPRPRRGPITDVYYPNAGSVLPIGMGGMRMPGRGRP